jgi:hypothetical protein
MLCRALQISGKAVYLQTHNALQTKLDGLDAQLQVIVEAFVAGRPKNVQRDDISGASTRTMYNHMEETLKTAEQFITRSRTITYSKSLLFV